jgi:urease accessory protein
VNGAVRAAAHVEAAAYAGATSLVRLRNAPPLVLRRTGPGSLHLVSAGAGPLGGDDLHLGVRVGPGGLPSRIRYDVELGVHAALRWDGQPTVAGAGCDHVSELRVTAAPSAALWWRDEVVCGRYGEASGTVRCRTTVVRGGRTVLRADTRVGDALWASAAVGGGARVAGSLLLLGRASEAATLVTSDRAAVLRPAEGVAVVTALGPGHPEVRAALVAAAAGGG